MAYASGTEPGTADTSGEGRGYGVLLAGPGPPHPRRTGQTYIESEPRFYRRWNDPRPTLRVMGDEFGCLGSGPGEVDSPFFGVGTVAFPDLAVAYDLIRLGIAIRLRGGGDTVGRYFSGKSDRPRTREEVFEVLARHQLRIDISYVDRRTLPNFFSDHPIALYRAVWTDHLIHTLPGILVPDNVVYLDVASIHTDTRQRDFERAYAHATGVSLAPLYADYCAQRDVAGRGFPSQPDVRGLPLLAIGQVDPRSNRLSQAADYCLWAVQRNLRDLPNSHLDQLLPSLRSLRRVDFIPMPGLALTGVSAPVGDRALDDFLPRSTYTVGPADSSQALHAARQELLSGRPEWSFKYLLDVNGARLPRHSVELLRFCVRSVVPAVATEHPYEVAALIHLAFGDDFGDLKRLRASLLNAAYGWMQHHELALNALHCFREHSDFPSVGEETTTADALDYLEALVHQRVGLHREAHKSYARIVKRTRTATDITPIWACATVNFARAIAGGSHDYAEQLLENMLQSVAVGPDFCEPRAKGALALARLRGRSSGEYQALLALANQAIAIGRDQDWVTGFEPLLREAEHVLSAA